MDREPKKRAMSLPTTSREAFMLRNRNLRDLLQGEPSRSAPRDLLQVESLSSNSLILSSSGAMSAISSSPESNDELSPSGLEAIGETTSINEFFDKPTPGLLKKHNNKKSQLYALKE